MRKTILLLALTASAAAENTPAPEPSSNPMELLTGLIRAFQGQSTNEGQSGAMAAAAQLITAFTGDTNSTNNPLAALGGKTAVDFRELKALLPAECAGLGRASLEGEKTGAFGANVSTAVARYGTDQGPRVEIKITDLGAMGPLGAMAGVGWMAGEIDRESTEGYERTTMLKGRKALEKYRNADQSGSWQTMVGGRFLVDIEGQSISAADLATAASSVDYDALERLANRPDVP